MAMLTALFDACVLHPAPLRDLLMRLAMTELFRARWSDTIHKEWIRSVLRQRPELAVQLKRTRHLMDAHVMDSLGPAGSALGPPMFWQNDVPLLYSDRLAWEMWAFGPYFALMGSVAGFTYWWIAGRRLVRQLAL